MAGVHIAPFPDPPTSAGRSSRPPISRSPSSTTSCRRLTSPADTAAFLVEPVLGEGGYVPANDGSSPDCGNAPTSTASCWWSTRCRPVRANRKVLGGEHFDAEPDILITAKGLASGFPLSGIAASSELMAKAWPGSQGGTYGANAVACAAALATLDVIRDEGLVDNSAQRGAQRRACSWWPTSTTGSPTYAASG